MRDERSDRFEVFRVWMACGMGWGAGSCVDLAVVDIALILRSRDGRVDMAEVER